MNENNEPDDYARVFGKWIRDEKLTPEEIVTLSWGCDAEIYGFKIPYRMVNRVPRSMDPTVDDDGNPVRDL